MANKPTKKYGRLTEEERMSIAYNILDVICNYSKPVRYPEAIDILIDALIIINGIYYGEMVRNGI